MSGQLSALMTLRVQGLTTAERAAAALDVSNHDAAAGLASLVHAELAAERTGRLCGFTLTPKGADALDKALVAEGLRANESIHECYQRFHQLNNRVLKVSSDWQIRREGAVEVPNDHSDPGYDAEVIDRLTELHARARTCLQKISECAPRFAPYTTRLDGCVERLQCGDRTAFTAPLAESYHTVWFELHQDLLLTLGLEREQ